MSGEQKSVEDQIKEQQKRVDDAQSKLDALTAGCNTAVEYCPPEDIEAAKKLNMKIIAVDWGFSSKELLEKSEPDAIVSSEKELADL